MTGGNRIDGNARSGYRELKDSFLLTSRLAGHSNHFLAPAQRHHELLRHGAILIVILDHEEALSVGGHIVIRGSGSRRSAGTAHTVRVVAFPQLFRAARLIPGSSRNMHGHHAVTVAVEQLTSVTFPHRIGTAVAGNLDFCAWPGVGLHIHLGLAGFIGAVSHPFTVRRKL